MRMTSNWAAEHLQVIRILMERSAVYRRALAPIMLMTGTVGIVASVVAWKLHFHSSAGFIYYWMGVGAFAMANSYMLVRRQALRASEPFWSPPTRRVSLALLPAVFVGLVVALVLLGPAYRDPWTVCWLPPVWMVLYGFGFNAAGFFMPRGMKLFGWVFILAGCALLASLSRFNGNGVAPMSFANATMGLFFGGLHVAYGIYLYFTEKRKSAT
jgi:hypothetical protein